MARTEVERDEAGRVENAGSGGFRPWVKKGLGLLFVLVSVTICWQIFQTYREIQDLNAQIEMTRSVMNSEEQALLALKKQATRLQNDEYVLKLARSNYYLSRDGERLYNTPHPRGRH